jgi:osmotically-inducible protein OsmY
MNDKDLCHDVLDELEFEPSIDSEHIGVTAANGVVTLSGYVPSYAQKMAAERAAWRVKGVRAIAQEIAVRLPNDKKINDDEIAERAIKILAWNAWIPDEAVQVRVSHGWVTLTGQVEWNFLRQAAEREVRKLSGVLGVINDITLHFTAHPTDIKQRILDALKRHAVVESKQIRVDVHDNGVVELHGHIDDWKERQAVEHAVWSTPGVRAIEDHMRIG